MIGTDNTSIIGENSYFTGKFYIKASLRIDGFFEGRSLEVTQLYVGSTGYIKADNITIDSNIIVEGLIIGNITAKKRVMLLPTAKILGDIYTSELIIQDGVLLEGKCVITKKEGSSVKNIVEQEYKNNFPAIDKLFSSSKDNI